MHKRNAHRRTRRQSSVAGVVFDNSDDIDLILQKSKLVQDILGFSGDDVSKLFEQSISLLHQHRFDEAIVAFRFLTQVNPYICDFWIGLGAAYQALGSFEEALSSYLVAETMDPERIDTYGYAIDLCIEMHNLTQARRVLNLGYAYAKSHGKGQSGQFLRIGLKKLKARILQEESMTGPSEGAVA
jgi:tetratricopeptide (TPR) repeat protein